MERIKRLARLFLSLLSLAGVQNASALPSAEIDARLTRVQEQIAHIEAQSSSQMKPAKRWLAQWGNWGNWGNWRDWPNWGNWGNWPNY